MNQITRQEMPYFIRLASYATYLLDLPAEQTYVSSDELAGYIRVQPSQVRRDFIKLRCSGMRGVGFRRVTLEKKIGETLTPPVWVQVLHEATLIQLVIARILA